MKNLLTCLAVAVAATVSGCVPSLHALYLKKDVVEDAEIVGTWHQENDKSIWKFAKSTNKGLTQYQVSVDIEEEGKAALIREAFAEFSAHDVEEA